MKNEARKYLEEIVKTMEEFKSKSGDEVIGKMLPQIAAIMVVLSEDMEKNNRRMFWLTIGIFFLTLVLVITTVMQLS